MRLSVRISGGFFLCLLVFGTGAGQGRSENGSRWSLDIRYGSAEFASPCATLPLKAFEVGRYVELSFAPAGAPDYAIAYTLARDSILHLQAGVGFQTNITTLDVSDTSLHLFREGEYPVAKLRISQIRAVFQARMYTDLPFGLGVGMLRVGAGTVYVWGSGLTVLDQGREFPGIQSIHPQSSWLLAMDFGVGYAIPGSSVTLTANATLNLQMEFVSNRDFLEIALAPESPYRFKNSGISPLFLSFGVLLDL